MPSDPADILARHWRRQHEQRNKARERLANRCEAQIKEDAARAKASRDRREARLESARASPVAPYKASPFLAKIVAVSDAVASSSGIDWADLFEIAAILSTGSTATCGHKLHDDHAEMIMNKDGRLRWTGSVLCASVWSCPKCSAIIAAVRCEEMKAAVRTIKEHGGVVLMETRTIAHAAGDRLALLLDRLAVARDHMRTSRAARMLIDDMANMGYIGNIRGLEVTSGLPNGWHPHEHAMLAFMRPLSPQQMSDLTARRAALWAEACRVAGLPPPSAQHGLTLIGGASADEQIAAYIAKFGRQPAKGGWGVEQELTLSVRKKGRDCRLHPFGLLRLIAAADMSGMSATAISWAKDQWSEYEKSMRGQRQLVISRRLSKWLEARGWRSVSDEEAMELAAEQEGDDLIGCLSEEHFNGLAQRRLIHPVLAAAQKAAMAASDREAKISAARVVVDEARAYAQGGYASSVERELSFLKPRRRPPPDPRPPDPRPKEPEHSPY